MDIAKWLSDLPILHGIYDITSGNAENRAKANGGKQDIDWVKGMSVPGGDRNPVNSVFSTSLGNQMVNLMGQTAPEDDPYYVAPANITDTTTPTDDTNTDTDSIEQQQQAILDALTANQNRKTNESRGIQSRILGRKGEIDTILNDIKSSIDAVVSGKKKSRQGKYDSDTADLINTLNAAIPEVQKAFAALGLSSSTFVGDRVDNTNKEYDKSQEAVDNQLDTDMTSYGNWEAGEKSKADTNAKNLKSNVDYVGGLTPDYNNLSDMQQSEQTFNTAMNNFGGEKGAYTTDSDALNKINSIGSDYDFSKIMDALASTAGSAANTGNTGAASSIASKIKGMGDDKKKKLTEVQVNNPVGVASA